MHDFSEMEARGIPSLFVASSEFRQAAAAQATALGVDPAVVFVAHPIQDRTDAEMRAIADGAFEEIVVGLVEGNRV